MTKRTRMSTLFSLSLIFLLLHISIAVPTTAQEEETNAEIVVNIEGATIPGIQKNWTAIKFTVYDFFGLPWDVLKDQFSNIQMRLIWPILFQIKDIERFLGYTSISFEVECPTGWAGKVEPATIPKTTGNYVHENLTLYLQVTDLATEYNPTIKIKCIRYDVLGDEYGISYLTLPVKASALNFAFVNALEPTKKAAPRSIVYFPIQISNKGEYRGIYQFKTEAQSGMIGLVSQQTLLLEPGETRVIQLGVRTPEAFYDVGTPRTINVIVTPLGSSSEQFVTSVIVITEGFYISPLISIALVGIIIIVLLIYFLFFYLKSKRDREIFGKPEKPWTIPEEKAYLQDLKQNNKEAYQQERTMMQDEYKSALLWYQDYRQTEKRQPVEEQPPVQKEPLGKKISTFLKIPEREPVKKEKPKKKTPVPLKKPAEKPKKETVAPTTPVEDKSKEDAIAKIKKEQEKQLRRLK